MLVASYVVLCLPMFSPVWLPMLSLGCLCCPLAMMSTLWLPMLSPGCRAALESSPNLLSWLSPSLTLHVSLRLEMFQSNNDVNSVLEIELDENIYTHVFFLARLAL